MSIMNFQKLDIEAGGGGGMVVLDIYIWCCIQFGGVEILSRMVLFLQLFLGQE